MALAAEKLRPSEIMTEAAFANALRVLQAIGGSTNGLIHLTAIAGRLGIDIDLDAFDRMGAETPVLVDLKPSGQHYMEDLEKAGGLAPVLREIEAMLDTSCRTVSGRTLGEDIAAAPPAWPQDVVRPVSDPIHQGGGIRVLGGNLAPNGAVIKQAAATPALLKHTGRAVVFDSLAATSPSGSIRPTSMSAPTTSSSSAMPVRRARRACPRPATSRSRRSSPRPASRTWSASPTPG